jgi:N6-adenosine-specific RNA methylase IME4
MASAFYDTMTTDDLCKLPISNIADKNCALIMWVTNPLLPDGLTVMDAWGFKYKTIAFVWHKTYSKFPFKTWCGLGNYTRGGAEICLLGIRGSMKRVHKSVYQIQRSPVENHSKKPAWVRDSIVKLFGGLPRIELFAREKTSGWDVWGDQI